MRLRPLSRAAYPRSLLFVPADRSGTLLPKALASDADGIILDLEDSVQPPAKSQAREAAVEAAHRHAADALLVVRVNSLDTEWGPEDVRALRGSPIAALMIPKVAGPADIGAVAGLIGSEQIGLIPTVETAAGVIASSAIAEADARVLGLALGAEDLAAELGIRQSSHGHELLYARSHIVLSAKAVGCWALDSPCVHLRSVKAVRAEAARARALGFGGKLVIHPAQVAPVHDAFSPTVAEIAAAERVVEVYELARRDGRAVAEVDGSMVDRPIALAAQQVLERANRWAASQGDRRNDR